MSIAVEAIILVVALAMAVQSVAYLREPLISSPGILPLFVAIVIVSMTLSLLVSDLRKEGFRLDKLRSAFRLGGTRDTVLRVLGWLALSVGYAVATPLTGFEWATASFLLAALYLYARLAWWKILTTAAGIALGIPLVFRYVFHTIIP